MFVTKLRHVMLWTFPSATNIRSIIKTISFKYNVHVLLMATTCSDNNEMGRMLVSTL